MTLFLAALAAAADPRPPTVGEAEEADLLFRRGVGEYRAGRIDDALIDLLASQRLVANRNVMFNIARCYEQLGNLASAWRWYAASAAEETLPEARREAEAALERLLPKVARVEITTEPAGATVYVDRRDLGSRGVTPLVLALPEGEHAFLFSLAGHADASVPGTLRIGERTEVTARLLAVDVLGQTGNGWTFSEVLAGTRVLLHVEPGRCEVLPNASKRVAAAPLAAVPAPTGRPPSRPRPSLFGPGTVTLVVASDGERSEMVLSLAPGTAGAAVGGAADLGRWALDRCQVTDAAALGEALDALAPAEKERAAHLFAHWAAVRGAEPDLAAKKCAGGDCAELAVLVAR